MSLVVNANKNDNSSRSNNMLKLYPDFDNILISPQPSAITKDAGFWSSITPTNFGVNEAQIWWTIINYISCNLDKDRIFWPTSQWWDWVIQLRSALSWTSIDGTASLSYRIGLLWRLSNGDIVWKRISRRSYITSTNWGYRSYFNWDYTGGSLTIKLSIKPWLIHSDWSINYIWEYDIIPTYIIKDSSHSVSLPNWIYRFDEVTPWIVAQDNDQVIVDIICTIQATSLTRSSNRGGNEFWIGIHSWVLAGVVKYSDQTFPAPFQISIE